MQYGPETTELVHGFEISLKRMATITTQRTVICKTTEKAQRGYL